MNSEMIQYNNNSAIIIFRIFPCFSNIMLNIEPNAAQHSVDINPVNASKNAKKI